MTTGATAAAQGAAPAPGTAAPFGDPAAVDAAHRTVRADGSIQYDLPWYKPEANPPPRWLTELIDLLDRFVKWVGDGWTVLMWIAIAAAVIALLLAIFPAAREWLATRFIPHRAATATPVGWQPEASVARALLDEADRLAAFGHYSEAVRLILHRSIEDIERWRGDALRPSLTSRDIARFDGLPDPARNVFSRIVADVERSLFAGNTLAESDWTRARADYAGFALGKRA
ncbi:hypothetical protein [Sphingomonas sp. LT1P40]|uniref:hypothetical protein n=1 Tax=Alteristakelama amylovorans TaxID=3096166 RepID=UPI002FC865C6